MPADNKKITESKWRKLAVADRGQWGVICEAKSKEQQVTETSQQSTWTNYGMEMATSEKYSPTDYRRSNKNVHHYLAHNAKRIKGINNLA